MDVTAPHLTHADADADAADVQRRPRARRRWPAAGFAGRRPAAPLRRAPASTPCPGRAGSPAPRRSRWRPALRTRRAARRRCSSWDGQLEDDARLVTAVARTAAPHGARVHTRVRVLEATGTSARCATSAPARPARSRARAVVNADRGLGRRPGRRVSCGPAAAPTWCCAARPCPGCSTAVMVPVPGATNRFVFAAPPARRHHLRRAHRRAGRGPGARRARADRGRDRLPARRGRRRVRPAAAPLRRGRGVRRAAAAARHATAPPPTCPASTPCSPRHRRGDGRRRQAHDVPADGRGRRRRRPGSPDGPLPHPRRCRCSARPRAPELAGVEAPPRLVRRFGTEAPLVLDERPRASPG